MRRRNLLGGIASLPLLEPALAVRLCHGARLERRGGRAPAARRSHECIQLKCSFTRSHLEVPSMTVDGAAVPGRSTDNAGRFFAFDVPGLKADREFRLRLTGAAPLSDEWPLRTFRRPTRRRAACGCCCSPVLAATR